MVALHLGCTLKSSGRFRKYGCLGASPRAPDLNVLACAQNIWFYGLESSSQHQVFPRVDLQNYLHSRGKPILTIGAQNCPPFSALWFCILIRCQGRTFPGPSVELFRYCFQCPFIHSFIHLSVLFQIIVWTRQGSRELGFALMSLVWNLPSWLRDLNTSGFYIHFCKMG